MVTYIVSIKKKIQNKQNNIINSYIFQMNIFYMPNKFIYQTERSLFCLECDNQREIRSVQTLTLKIKNKCVQAFHKMEHKKKTNNQTNQPGPRKQLIITD